MKVLDRTSDGLKRSYSVLLTSDELEKANVAKLQEIASKIKLDGFRPGKVPVSVVKRMYGDSLIEDAKKSAIDSAANQIIKEEDLKISFKFVTDIVKEDENGIEFSLKFELIPEFDLKDHSELVVPKYIVEVSEDEINKSAKDILERFPRYEDDADAKEVAEGQRVRIDMKMLSNIGKKGDANIESFDIDIGDKTLIDDFWKHLVGMKVGETKEIDIQYPKDFADKSLADKKIHYAITIKSILKKKDEQLDDEFAKSIGHESIASFKEWLKNTLKSQNDYLAHEVSKRELLDKLSDMYDFPIPSNMLEIERHEVEKQLRKEAPKYNKEFTEEMAAECAKIAEKRVRLGFIVASIAKVENVKVTNKEIAASIKNIAMMYPGREKEIYKLYNSPEAVNAVVGPILENKVVELLIQKVKIEEKNCTAEELKAIDEEPFDFFKDDNAEGEKSEPKKKPAAKKKKTEE